MGRPTISLELGRYLLTDNIRDEVDWYRTPQSCGEAPPPVQKAIPQGSTVITLPSIEQSTIPSADLLQVIRTRRSHRRFSDAAVSLEELAFLLYCTQGVTEAIHPAAVLRTVPSAGCRHPFETYLVVQRVTGLEPGVYRYLPLDHAVIRLMVPSAGLMPELVRAVRGQRFVAGAAVTFVWTAIPARTEWRYAEASTKVIALDAGHLCQNLYLACGAIGAGTCAIAAYDQESADRLVNVDGKEEMVVYLSPVGKLA